VMLEEEEEAQVQVVLDRTRAVRSTWGPCSARSSGGRREGTGARSEPAFGESLDLGEAAVPRL